MAQWTDPLGVYIALCDRLLQAGDSGGGGDSMGGRPRRRPSPSDDADAEEGLGLYGEELQLELRELVHLAGAVAKAGMGQHPLMNAISNALAIQLDYVCPG